MAKKVTKTATKSPAKKSGIWRKIITMAICIAIPLGLGFISSAITGDAMKKFGDFNQPPLAPPAWLFPVAWTILYILMGISLYLIYRHEPKNKQQKTAKKTAIITYFIQLAFNISWTPIFFLAEQYYFAFAWLLLMYAGIIVTMIFAGKLNKTAVWLLVPYLVWCTFAAYLNLGVAILN